MQVSLLLGALAALVGVVKYGVSVFPAWVYLYDFSIHWQDPSQAPLMVPPSDYLQVNFVAAFVAGVLHLTTTNAYFCFHLAIALIAIVLPFTMPAVRSSISTSKLIFIAIAGGPTLAMLVMWVNGYDGVTVIGLAVAACSRTSWLIGLGWLIATLNHPPLGVIAFAVWLPIMLLSDDSHRRRRLLRVLLSAGSVALGYLVNSELMSIWGGATSRYSWFIGQAQSNILAAYWPTLPLGLFSAVGVAWLLLLSRSVRSLRVVKIFICEVLVISFVEPLFIQDTSRAVALSTFAGLLTLLIALNRLLPREVLGALWRSYGIAAVIVPVPLVFSGTVTYVGWGGFQHLGDSLKPPAGYSLLR